MKKTLYDYCLEREDFLLLAQWDKQKNGELTSRDVSYGSHKKVNWLCENGHQWEAPVYTRSLSASGCPYCAGRKVQPNVKTLASEYPELAKQWHATRNYDLSPEEVSPGTSRKVWWRCEKGHEWQAQVKSRTQGSGCPVCSNRMVLIGENDLATTHPEIAAQWNTERNGSRTPQTVVGGNHSKVWWRCEKGHEWQATILARTSSLNGCPVCAGKIVVPGQNDLASNYPQIASQWHPKKNGELTPEKVSPYSNRKVWWRCELGHEFSAAVAARTMHGSGCPYCTGRKVLPGFNDLQTRHPLIAAQWYHPMNGALTPEQVTPGSRKKVWWQCAEGHVWKAVIFSRTGARKHSCPVCAGKVKKSTV